MTFQKLIMTFGILVFLGCSYSHAGLVVSGTEIAPGKYRFTFSQDAGSDAIQTPFIIPVNFQIDTVALGAVAGTYTGSITDGTTTLAAGLFGWEAPGGANVNPNNITSALNPGGVTVDGTAGIDFSVTNVSWSFGSNEGLSGLIQQAAPIPEPSSFAIFGLALCGLSARRRNRRSNS